MTALSLVCAAPGQLSASFCNSAGWRHGSSLVLARSISSARLPTVSMATATEPPTSDATTLPRRQFAVGILAASVLLGNTNLLLEDAEAVSSSRRALQSEQIPVSEYNTLPSGLKYYDLKVGNGATAVKGSRVAVHYVAKWKGITFMTSRQGMGVTGGSPYGFDIGASEAGIVLKGLDQGVAGMRVGGQRLLIVPPELAYGKRGVQEIPPNATIEFNVELLSIKQDAFGSRVRVVEG